MSQIMITVGCCLCSTTCEQPIQLPDRWVARYAGHDIENEGFCPDHAVIAEFAASQCPGCVGGWGDCPLWRAFACSSERTIGPADYAKIEQGICPRRVNGTMRLSRGGVEELDISERASVESGQAFSAAILAYVQLYTPERRQ